MDDDLEDLPQDLDDIEIIYSDGEPDEDEEQHFNAEDQFEDQQEDQIEAEIIDISKLTFSKHTKSVFNCAISKDQKLAVTGGEDDIAYVWSTDTGNVVFECTGHKDSVTEVGFNYNDQYIATGDMAGMIQVWSIKDRKLVWCFEGDDMEWLTWHPLANVLLCGCQTGDIYVWQIPSGNCKVLPAPSNVSSTCGKVLPNGKQLLAGYQDGQLRLWDIKESAAIWINSDNDTINGLDVNGDASLVVTTPAAQIVKITDGKSIGKVLLDGETEIESALFNNSLGVVVTGSLSGQLCVWQLGKFVLRHQAKIECSVTLLKAGSENKVFVGATDGAVYVCDVKSGTLIEVLTGHRTDILSIAPFADGNRVLTTSDDGTAKIFHIS
ncbi:angio-associated migratory cell protein [Anthonomus grandis grandis]|uniref:angio-associated migratory cell protein n=1 Tax=Anthonomus grandis grandis TaxID=2921223 RepID=UPI002165FB39|nr:angio-associated migratory cell protein [Anthonomus grandis grandis]